MPIIIILAICTIAVILWDWYEVSRDNRRNRYISKPLAISLIIILFLTQVTSFQFPVWLFLVGLLFGLAGDVLLMFQSDTCFILGLSSFLLGHLAYIIGFFSVGVVNPVWGAVALLVPVAGIIYIILRRLLPSTEQKMKVPVFAYAIVIGFMLYSALCLLLKNNWDPTATILAIAGAGLFVTSDTFLALWKFERANTEFWPMVTYHLAQLSIAAAVVIQFAR